jgi:hypothetical protein
LENIEVSLEDDPAGPKYEGHMDLTKGKAKVGLELGRAPFQSPRAFCPGEGNVKGIFSSSHWLCHGE